MLPRDYQINAAREAISKNSIVNIQTGGGKTLIAVLVIDHFLQEHHTKNILFIVPSRALVIQQANYIRINCKKLITKGHGPIVSEMCGQESEGWNATNWAQSLRDNNVIVGTAEVFRRAFVDCGYISPTNFSLIIFDECHNAIGNSPMAAIMRDAILQCKEPIRPRILGLTASFVNGSLANIVTKRQKLESLLNSNLISPEITDSTSSSEKTFHAVAIAPEFLDSLQGPIEQVLLAILNTMPDYLVDQKEKRRWTLRGLTVFTGLGLEALMYWLREGILMQLVAEAEELKLRPDIMCKRKAEHIIRSLTHIRICMESSIAAFDVQTSSQALSTPLFLAMNTLPPGIPALTQKCLRLLQLLLDIYQKRVVDNNTGITVHSFRGIVFVEQIAMTYTIAYIVNKYFTRAITEPQSETIWPMLPISGANSMLENTRTENLQKFRTGRVPLLVSTTALEEGIDVPECSFIVRFDHVHTTKAHIQGSGRARCANAEIFYFENNPTVECLKSDMLERVARDSNLNLTKKELEASVKEVSGAIELTKTTFIYPYRARDLLNNNTAELNFFNCLQILYEYVQIVMSQSLNPEDCLYEITHEETSSYPKEYRSVVASVNFPCPVGVITITADEVKRFWDGNSVENVVLPRERLKNMDPWDIEKRRFVYAVTVRMHEDGWLVCNRPSNRAKTDTKRACSAYKNRPSMRLSHKISMNSLKSTLP
eukprot:gene10221-21311_t